MYDLYAVKKKRKKSGFSTELDAADGLPITRAPAVFSPRGTDITLYCHPGAATDSCSGSASSCQQLTKKHTQKKQKKKKQPKKLCTNKKRITGFSIFAWSYNKLQVWELYVVEERPLPRRVELQDCFDESRLRSLGKETEEAAMFRSHPQLLVPEQQFAAGLVQLQPVDLGLVADGSQVESASQVHWRGHRNS